MCLTEIDLILIITSFRNCKCQTEIYLINHASGEALITGAMIPFGTNSHQQRYRLRDSSETKIFEKVRTQAVFEITFIRLETQVI